MQLTADTDTVIFTCSTTAATKSVNFCNTGASSYTLRLYRTSGGAPTAADALVYDRAIAANGEYERTGIYLTNGQKLYARVSNAAVVVDVFGPEG